MNYAQNYQTQLQTQLSGIQDADEAQSITDLTQAQTQLQAAMESRAKMPQTELVRFSSVTSPGAGEPPLGNDHHFAELFLVLQMPVRFGDF